MINGLNNMYSDITNLYDINADDITSSNIVTESINGVNTDVLSGITGNIQNQIDTINSDIINGGGGYFIIDGAFSSGFVAGRYCQYGGSSLVLVANVPLQFDFSFKITAIAFICATSPGVSTVKLYKNNIVLNTFIVDDLNVNFDNLNYSYIKGDTFHLYCSTVSSSTNNGGFVRAIVSCAVNSIIGPTGPPGTNGTSIIWRNIWSNSTVYAINDAVQYNGSSYIAISQNSNSMPPSPNWNLITQKGDTGLQGDRGIQGSQGIQGIKGDDGPQGIQGPKGDTSAITDYVNTSSNQSIDGIKIFLNSPVFSGASIESQSILVDAIDSFELTEFINTFSYVNTYSDQSIEGEKIFLAPPVMNGSKIADNSIRLASMNGLNANYLRKNIDQTITNTLTFQTNPIFNDASIPASKISGYVAGTPGPQGIQGIKGDDGASIQGPQGIQGIKGDDGKSIIWKGIWINTITYNINDTVQYLGNSYICIVQNINSIPSSLVNWNLMSSKGDKGDTGDKGDKGDKGDQGDTGDSGTLDPASSAAIIANSAAIVVLQGEILVVQGQITTLQGEMATVQGQMTSAQTNITTLQDKTQNQSAIINETTFTGTIKSDKVIVNGITNSITLEEGKITCSEINSTLLKGNQLTIDDLTLTQTLTGSTINIDSTSAGDINIGHFSTTNLLDYSNVNINGYLYVNGILYTPFNSNSFFSQWS